MARYDEVTMGALQTRAQPNVKCVMILAENLPRWLSVNTAVVLALSLAHHVPSLIGEDVTDGSGLMHPGITLMPIPILQASKETIKTIQKQAKDVEDLQVIDFTTIAQATGTYQEYTQQMSTVSSHALEYLGIILYGEKRIITKLTKKLSLFS